jgi:hypothetical protein
MSAAEKVISFARGRSLCLLVQSLQRLIDMTRSEQVWRRLRGHGQRDRQQENY